MLHSGAPGIVSVVFHFLLLKSFKEHTYSSFQYIGEV